MKVAYVEGMSTYATNTKLDQLTLVDGPDMGAPCGETLVLATRADARLERRSRVGADIPGPAAPPPRAAENRHP